MMLNLAKPCFGRAAIENLQECIETGWVSSQGSFVTRFEEGFAKYMGAKYSSSTHSGTSALHLALTALGIGKGDEVLVPTYTFIASANAVTYTGALPIFCKVHLDTLCLDVEDAENRISANCKAIMPVHINGYPVDMSSVIKLALNYDLHIIEDACQALGSTYLGRRLGSIGTVGCFSFFANKQLVTGEGGMCITRSPELAEELRLYRDHGRSGNGSYVHEVVGFNYRMTNLQAAIGLPQLETLDEESQRRRALHWRMHKILGHTQPYSPNQTPWLYHYNLRTEEEQRMAIQCLSEVGIESKPYFTHCHLQPPYSESENIMKPLYGVLLPLHNEVTEDHIYTMKEVLNKCC